MNKYLALSLIPANAMAEDFVGQKGVGLVIILALGAAIWIIGAKILRTIFRKDTTETEDKSNLRK